MFQINKIISIVLVSTMTLPSIAMAVDTSTGTFSLLSKGEKAPFDGILLDPYATGTILSEKESLQDKCKLDMEFEKSKLDAKHKLELDNLQISLKTNKDTTKIMLEEKDKELSKLRDIALHSSDNSWMYIAGGFVGGVLLTAFGVWGASQLSK